MKGAPLKHTTDYAQVMAEMKRQGIWDGVESHPLPNCTVSHVNDDGHFEMFYVQTEPMLACWATYDDAPTFAEVLNNFTNRRLRKGDTQVVEVWPKEVTK